MGLLKSLPAIIAMPFRWDPDQRKSGSQGYIGPNIALVAPEGVDYPGNRRSISRAADRPPVTQSWTLNLLETTLAAPVAVAALDALPGKVSIGPAFTVRYGPSFSAANLLATTLTPPAAVVTVTYQLTPLDWPITLRAPTTLWQQPPNTVLLSAPGAGPSLPDTSTVLSNKKASGPYFSRKQWRELEALIAAERAAQLKADSMPFSPAQRALSASIEAAAELRGILVDPLGLRDEFPSERIDLLTGALTLAAAATEASRGLIWAGRALELAQERWRRVSRGRMRMTWSGLWKRACCERGATYQDLSLRWPILFR
jgi:hypothetical protein